MSTAHHHASPEAKVSDTGSDGGRAPPNLRVRGAVQSWTVDDVCDWLHSGDIQLGQHADRFRQQSIDGIALGMLTQNDLTESLGVDILGDAKRLLHHIATVMALHTELFPSSQPQQHGHRRVRLPPAVRLSLLDANLTRKRGLSLETPGGALTPAASWSSAASDEARDWIAPEDMPEFSCGLVTRAIFGALYFGFSILMTSIVMVFVHERVPDQAQYPPLPDLFLDNIPRIPVAFKLTEMIGVVLFIILCVVVMLHKHRLIILRRGLSIAGSIFLLRCVTMLATSLSVPSRHLQCEGGSFGDTFEEKMARAWEIASHFGMTIAGVQTCGDYLFSGHSVAVTMLNFLITEYTPYHGLHIFTWSMNLFGLFFVLAAHEHYSVDVLVAFYISSRLFMYYHSLANLNALSDENTPSWYPMFSYLEEDVSSVVPNTLGWPWCELGRWYDSQKAASAAARMRTPHRRLQRMVADLKRENKRLKASSSSPRHSPTSEDSGHTGLRKRRT